MNKYLKYDPGDLPTRKPPNKGKKLFLQSKGLPPRKKRGASLRNPKHPRYDAFVALREAAAKAMKDRAWYSGPIRLSLTIYCEEQLGWYELNEHIGGVMDTLDGSSGVHFTYLPVVYEDDCQVFDSETTFKKSDTPKYDLAVELC